MELGLAPFFAVHFQFSTMWVFSAGQHIESSRNKRRKKVLATLRSNFYKPQQDGISVKK